METEVNPTYVTIDRDGDLILLVGPEESQQTRILVSSKALTLASKVFKAMLSKSTFKEGRELVESAANSTLYEIPLPDDDIAAMIILCKLVHHRYRNIDLSKVTIQHLSDIAVLAYKYDSVDAVRSTSSWLQRFDEYKNAAKLLKISFLLDHAEVFKSSSHTILCGSSRDILFGSSKDAKAMREEIDPDDQMPKRIFVQLEKRRNDGMNLISPAIEKRRKKMWTDTSQLSNTHGESNDTRTVFPSFSKHDAEQVRTLVEYLELASVWSMGKPPPPASLEVILTLLKGLSNASADLGREIARRSYCQTCTHRFPVIFDEIYKELFAATEGLCLDCVKQNGKAAYCRVKH
ncbi:hypothetical protein EG327_001378 [Venturia inaequalis]|uniref:BTB domain-containing protein n=1 Tax=Venturia inaequalis TaxID=5025 RepID=A0A8H3ZFR3_VENIN|nr:hypothetical protein EG327_001378 [Venturia inaequalis]